MALQDLLKSFDDLNTEQVQAVQAKSNDVLQVTTGSDLLALIESNSALAVWLQSIAVYLYAFARASTSAGTDLDSWMAQFDFERLLATYGTTNVTFSRIVDTQPATILVGIQVTTQIGNIIFNVIEDSTNPYWVPIINGYSIPTGTASASIPVKAAVAGITGNVAANQINLIVSAIPFINSVTNPNAVTNAQDIETDPAFIVRFILYINSLSKATPPAINAAIESVQDGILFNVLENENYALTTQLGFFTIIIDDGSGNPPDSLVIAVNNIIAITRGLSIKWGTYKTVPVTVTISANLVLDPTYNASLIVVAVQNALIAYVNNLNVGTALEITKLPNIIYKVSPGILNIQTLEVNGATSDVTPTPIQSLKTNTGSITLTTSNP